MRIRTQLALGLADGVCMISKVARSVSPESVVLAPAGRATSVAPSARQAAGTAFSDVLARLERELDRGEAMLDRAVSGGPGQLGARDLIALQAGIYRYSEVVDLSAKLIERTSSALRTTLGNAGA